MSGFASNAGCAGPDRRLVGTALSAKLSTKSRTIKSLLEKFSRVKLGPLGKRLLAPVLVRSMVRRGLGRSPIAYMCRSRGRLLKCCRSRPSPGDLLPLGAVVQMRVSLFLEYGGALRAQPHWWLLRHTKRTQAHARRATNLLNSNNFLVLHPLVCNFCLVASFSFVACFLCHFLLICYHFRHACHRDCSQGVSRRRTVQP